ncbi:MAG: hypothetical protein IPO32_19700 [Crocinitomicaceae bacterium]|nr:hypothetical protein [Crocinitomicaceae bacterium]
MLSILIRRLQPYPLRLLFYKPPESMIDGGAGGSFNQPQHSFRVEWANGVLGGDPINPRSDS